jgi:itaconate CoA-transferase
VLQRLELAGIANARINEMHEVWAHPQLAARQRWTQVDTPAGPIPALLPPALPDSVQPRMGPVPGLGEHTDSVLGELGYSREAIASLRAERAI